MHVKTDFSHFRHFWRLMPESQSLRAERPGRSWVADQEVEGLVRDLSASFEARVARAEEIAAADLAVSLEQDADIPDALSRWRGACIAMEDLPPLAVTEVGRDYLSAGIPTQAVVPLSRAIVTRAPSESRPVHTDQLLILALRPWSRDRLQVRVKAEGRIHQGRLVRAAWDHLLLGRGQHEVLIGLGALEWITPSLEG
jgi:hypothetical protein